MKKPALTGYTFNPSAKTLDFSATSGWTIQSLAAVIHEPTGKTLYAKSYPPYAPKSVSGSVLTLADGVDTTGMNASDALYVLREDGADVATDARLATTNTTLTTISNYLRGSTTTTDVAGTLTAATNAVPVAANATRSFIEITNTGANPLAYRWGAAATATAGHILGPGQTARYDDKVPAGALNMISTLGTTYFVTVG